MMQKGVDSFILAEIKDKGFGSDLYNDATDKNNLT